MNHVRLLYPDSAGPSPAVPVLRRNGSRPETDGRSTPPIPRPGSTSRTRLTPRGLTCAVIVAFLIGAVVGIGGVWLIDQGARHWTAVHAACVQGHGIDQLDCAGTAGA